MTCSICREKWPSEVLKLAAWLMNGRAEAILICPTCQARYLGHNPNCVYMDLSEEVKRWLEQHIVA